MTKWQPLLSSALVSIIIGVTGCVILYKGTLRIRKTHLMNVFNQQFYSLIFYAFLARSFLWVVFVNPGESGDNVSQ